MHDVHVVIVTYNGEQWIRRLLDSLRASLTPCHVIVVDNASKDDTVPIIRRDYPEVELMALSDNHGFGIGNNVGISQAIANNAKHIFLLNQDAYVTEDAISKLSAFLSNNLDYDVASPLHCSPDLHVVDSETLRFYLQKYATTYLSDACLGQTKEHYPIAGVNAAAWFVRTSAFKRVGGFDPLFFMYGEDDDLIARFTFHRAQFALVPDAKIVHLRERSPAPPATKWRVLQRTAERVRSALLADLKAPGLSLTYIASLLIAKGIVVPIADYLIQRNGNLLIAHFIATIRLIGEIRTIRRHGRLCASPGAHFLEV